MQAIQSQPVTADLTSSAIFLVATLDDDARSAQAVRALCADLSALVRGVGFRESAGSLSCILGFGSLAWDRLFGSASRPKELHPFREIHGVHHAPATPGDLLLHIRAARMDLCFELAAQIMARLGTAATVVDETQGFKYFDARDLLGFVDGTENPVGPARNEAVLIGDEDPAFAGGSYVIVQKYLHDLAKWEELPVERQEGVIGRRKLSDIELDDAVKPSFAHNVLTSITDDDGNALEILRDNMPFGSIAGGEYGTYFIGYGRSPSRVERMLQNMFVGNPPGNYDRLLDVSRAVTGTLFFVPSASFLDDVPPLAAAPATPAVPAAAEEGAGAPRRADGSLGIGSLKDPN